jgi:GTP-binding protein EngB required for normal cell division
MEEDIKELELFKNQTFYGRLEITQEAYKRISEAIENLLKRYKELDEYTLSLEEEDKKYPIKLTESGYKKLIENKGIPISVIQNKIDELIEKENSVADGIKGLGQILDCRTQVKVLQELLDLKE